MVDKHPLKISFNHKSFYLLYFLKATYILKATQDYKIPPYNYFHNRDLK